MAIALEKLEDQLNCPICLDTYTNPKQLQCHHVYCQQCLVKLVVRDQQGQLTLTCPNCRQVTPVPASGVAGLQSAFQINKFLEIVEEHKKATVATKKKESVSIPCEQITAVCPEHGGKELDLYCETCEETICWECIMKGSKHHSHEYQKLNQAFERYKEEIASSLEPLEKQLTTIEKALKAFDVRRDEISHQQATIEAEIHDTITRLQTTLYETLEVRKTELINQLGSLTRAKFKSLASQRDQIETTQAQLSSCLHFMKENLKTEDKGGALMMKSTSVRQVKELTTIFQPDMLEPNQKANMIFSTLAELTANCQNYGNVYEVGPPDPSKCSFIGKGVDTAAVGEKSTAILQVLGLNNHPCKPLTTSISCELVSEIAGAKARCSVERRGQSQYQISYQPTIKGRHQLHIKVKGQHIRGSPFPVSARSPLGKLDIPILTLSELEEPQGVAVNQKGEVVVTEWNGHCVSVFSPGRKKLRSFGTYGSRHGQFLGPYGIAVDTEDNIYVTDNNNHRVQKFTSQGELLKAVGTRGHEPLQFLFPRGIAFNSRNGRVYVVDDGSGSRVQILTCDLNYVNEFGSEQFNCPRHVACDSIGNIYVADTENHRIQVFTSDGVPLRMYSGELNRPWGVAVDQVSGRVYASEVEKCRVSVLSPDGQLVTSFGRKGEESGEFSFPYGLTVDNCGVVYVCDEKHIQLF